MARGGGAVCELQYGDGQFMIRKLVPPVDQTPQSHNRKLAVALFVLITAEIFGYLKGHSFQTKLSQFTQNSVVLL